MYEQIGYRPPTLKQTLLIALVQVVFIVMAAGLGYIFYLLTREPGIILIFLVLGALAASTIGMPSGEVRGVVILPRPKDPIKNPFVEQMERQREKERMDNQNEGEGK